MIKTSRKERPLDRSVSPVRDARLIIIATEGRLTEKQYFTLFCSRRVQIKTLPTSDDGHSSPQHVLDRLNAFKDEYNFGHNDEFWLMVDVDRWGDKKLAEVTQEALGKGYKLSISNPCFEVWLLCHFQKPSSAEIQNCDGITGVLRTALGGSYNKSNLNVASFSDRISVAIENAKTSDPDLDPSARWPSDIGTHVYKVVDLIRSLG